MILSIFDIPHLNERVTQYLTRKEIFHCTLTSKQWSNWFIPALWNRIDAVSDKCDLLTLARHHDHVRSITNYNSNSVPNIITLASFPNLNSLQYFFEQSSSLVKSKRLEHISKLPSLRKLDIHMSDQLQCATKEFLQLLASIPTLRQLEVTASGMPSILFLPQLLETCRLYDSLSLNFSFVKTIGESEELLNVDIAIWQVGELNLRDLTLETDRLPPMIISSILRFCPLLRRLTLKSVSDPEILQALADLFRENFCPQLEHLTLECLTMLIVLDDTIEKSIQAIGRPNKKQVESIHGDFGEIGTKGLKSFGILFPLYYHPSAQSLVECHANTITTLDLYKIEVPFSYLVACTTGLPLLRSLRVALSVSCHTHESSLRKQWSCLGLEKLTVRLNGVDGFMKYEKRGWCTPAGELTWYIFREIGRMGELQELRVRSDVNILKLKYRFITYLLNLKRLILLGTTGLEYDSMGKREAIWMAENWPRLGYIELGSKHEPLSLFKETLLGKKPYVRIQ
ncbi:hypothetical protein BGZ46_008383 [Entomortierella lignicola]|nr:hypothetical protein BGZ46_008383 [Entomortierella lignicola]